MKELDNETFEEFINRHGYKNGKIESIEELIYWSSVYTYENKRNWRRQVMRIRKTIDAAKKYKNEK